MPYGKRVVRKGTHLKGYKLTVEASTGDYVLDLSLASGSGLSSISVIPDEYGAGDYYKLEHLDANGTVLNTFAETIYNIGAYIAKDFELPAFQVINAGESLKLTYTNAAGIAMNVYVTVERLT